MGSRNRSRRGVRTSDTVQDELKQAHALVGRSWRKVALLAQYKGIPAGTLSSIAKDGIVPKKWRGKLGMQVEAPAPVCPIHGVVHVGGCPRQRKYKDLFDMPVKELRWRFTNREEIK